MEKTCIKCKKNIISGKYYRSKTGKLMCAECYNKIKSKQNQISQKREDLKPSVRENHEKISQYQINQNNQQVTPRQYPTWSDNDIQTFSSNYQQSQKKDIFCPICNSKISNNDNFCQNCGAIINHPSKSQNDSYQKYQDLNQPNPRYWQNYNQNNNVSYYNNIKRVDIKGIISTIIVIIIIFMIIFSFFLPWYSVDFEYKEEDYFSKSNTDYYLTKLSWESKGSDDFDVSENYDYEELRNYSNAEEILEPFDNAKIFSILLLVFSIICLIFNLVYLSKTVNPKAFRITGEIFCVIIFIFSLIAVFLFAYQITENLETMVGGGSIGEVKNAGFWFSKSEGGYSISSGPGLSWYFMFISGILSIIASIFLFKKGSILNATEW